MACLLGTFPLASCASAKKSASFLRSLIIGFGIVLLSVSSAGQQPKVLAPHKPIRPRMEKPHPLGEAIPGSMVGGPWMIDANFKSTLYLKNVVETSPVTVTPILYLSNGAKYSLPAVTLEPAGTAVIDINEGLRQQGISPWATLTGYAEIQYSWPWDPICATIHNVDTAHSLIFSYTLQSSKPFHPGNQGSTPTAQATTTIVEGLWWKQEANVTGFVWLANASLHPTSVTVHVSDNQMNILASHRVVVSPHGTKVVSLEELQSAASSEGGIRITYDGPSNDMLINGGLEDRGSGYSAILPFTHDLAASRKTSQISVAELGLMVGAADPMMSFPASTRFTPYSVLRNVSDAPASLTPTLWWVEGGTARSAQLAKLALLPYSSQSLDVMAMISKSGLNNFNGSVNLVFDVQGTAGGLLMAAGSVDQTNNYVFEVTPRGIVESASKSLSYWSTANGDDTMVNLWNPSDEAQDLVFKLSFSGGHYGLPIHLEPRVSRTFNVSEIIQNQIPDLEGNIIPASVHEGGATIAGSNGDNEHILVALDAGTYNVRKATCGLYCQGCDGVTGYSMVANPFSIAVNGQKQQTFYQNWNTGSQYDNTSTSTWQSSSSNIATVQTGLVYGMSAGSVTISATDNFPEPVYTSYWCEGSQWSCPLSYFTNGNGSSGGNVTTTVTFSGTPVVPQGKTATITATVSPSNNTSTITLTLATTSGSGSALFLNGSSSMTITTTTALTVLGAQVSSTSNNISLTATITVGSQKTTIGSTTLTVGATNGGALPVNFMQTGATILSNAYLQFTYTWGSSSGSPADISQCQVREFVTYPGYVQGQQLNYYWTSPPYVNTFSPNPTTGEQGPASGLGLTDVQGNVGFIKPYKGNSAPSNQVYQFQCPYYQNNQWVQFAPQIGTISITRVVQLVGTTWKYTITKAGVSATGALP